MKRVKEVVETERAMGVNHVHTYMVRQGHQFLQNGRTTTINHNDTSQMGISAESVVFAREVVKAADRHQFVRQSIPFQ